MTDDYLRVLAPVKDVDTQVRKQEIVKDVYAIGDCAVIDGDELPATAQVASQQGAWLRKRLNLIAKRGLLTPPTPSTFKSQQPIRSSAEVDMAAPKTEESKDIEASVGRGFHYHNILTMAYLGSWNAIAQRSKGHGIRGFVISLLLVPLKLTFGSRFAWFLWRGAYMTKTISLRNKIRVPILWSVLGLCSSS
jgi:NADH dehydrogenase